MNPANELKVWQQKAQAQTELLLERFLPSEKQVPHTLHEAMRYVTLGGGKRLRPLLVLAASELGDADQNAVEQAMAAIEMVHVYSLVHDDMPAMDNDSLRRGKPTCHVQYDEATALLVGDALQTQAFDVLSRPTGLPAVVLGALACPDLDSDDVQTLDNYAAKLGLAFQVIDDVLDCEADTATLGKTAGKDSDNDKPTYVKLMGLQAARAYAETLTAEAAALLEPFGAKALHLWLLAEFVTARKN